MKKEELQSLLEKLKLERQQTLINFGALEGKIEMAESWLAAIVKEEQLREVAALNEHRNGERKKAVKEG